VLSSREQGTGEPSNSFHGVAGSSGEDTRDFYGAAGHGARLNLRNPYDITTNPPVTSDCVIIVDHLSSQAYEWAGLGATLLVLSSGDGSLDPLQTVPESFHPSWWYVSSQAICRCRE
jgi:hypothetical protein